MSRPKITQYGWIGVDLDGTLARDDIPFVHYEVGPPVDPMLARVKAWCEAGYEVRILTARVSVPGGLTGKAASTYRSKQRASIKLWLREHLGYELPITNIKDQEMLELWDDRAIQVVKNTGIPVTLPVRKTA
jgi:hypothetical protein